jgi:hypothetical protein
MVMHNLLGDCIEQSHFLEVSGSNLDRAIIYLHHDIRGFPQCLQMNVGIYTHTAKLRPLSYILTQE